MMLYTEPDSGDKASRASQMAQGRLFPAYAEIWPVLKVNEPM
ncbi:hypothetical protein [Altererythrobacter lutimaris]|nr:hypothetical protein [Altererythrobacter lutimaris]